MYQEPVRAQSNAGAGKALSVTGKNLHGPLAQLEGQETFNLLDAEGGLEILSRVVEDDPIGSEEE